MRLIESYDDHEVVTIAGRTYPAQCLIEDEDGVRIAVVRTLGEVSVHIWTKAHSAGARMLACPDPWLPGKWLAVSVETFMSERTEGHLNQSLQIEASVALSFEEFPSYRDLRGASLAAVEQRLAARGFVHLHTHAEFSPLDGLSTVKEIVTTVVGMDQPGVAITDHGVNAGHPELQIEADKAGIKPIFGIEANFVNDRHLRGNPEIAGDAKKVLGDYFHLILWAQNNTGLRNIWAASTEANREGFYGRPRMDWETISRFSEGVMASTACLRGPVARRIIEDDEDGARAVMARLLSIFGDRLYVELHTNGLPEQKKVNEALVGLANDYGLPMVAVVDSHYPTAEQKKSHEVWIASQTGKDVNDDADLFAGDTDYHLMSEAEVRAALAYLGDRVVDEAVANTTLVMDRADATVQADGAVPIFSKAPTKDAAIDRDVARLVDLCLGNWKKKIATGPKRYGMEVYEARFEQEMSLLIDKKFCGYYLMVADYCLDPSTPVLTEDLRWVEVGKLEPGDRLAGFDEDKVLKPGGQKAHRYWRGAEVVNTRRIMLPTYRVVLADGTETITSGDHQWMVASSGGSNIRWVRTQDLRAGQRPQRLVDQWGEPDTWEAGYIAGILDGEGSLSRSKVNNGGHSLSLGFAQKAGVVLDTALRILDSWGFDYSLKDHGRERNGLRSVWLRGGRSEVLRLLGMARPQRLLAKLDVESLGRLVAIGQPEIVSIESLGQGEVVALETTTGTLVAQGFAHHNCRWARANGILVGPGRGSGSGSLVAFLADIVEIDPVETDLMFERFLTPGRTSLPDFDVDFPSSKRTPLTDYIIEKYGRENVVRVGTHIRMKNKGVVRSLSSVLKTSIDIHFPDIDAVSAIIDAAEADKAGLGMSWEDLWDEHGDVLQPYRAKYPTLFEHADVMVGRLNTYGKHPAGVVIAPDANLAESFPMRLAGDDLVIEFGMEAAEKLGLVKFDLLTLRTLDTIQMAVDLIREQRGDAVNVYDWVEEYRDPQVWDEISDGHTLGIFQIETPGGTRDTKLFRPQSLDELADVITLVRPGPKRSGLTDTYYRRKIGEEEVTVLDPRLEPVLAGTYGCMIYQEQVINTCRALGGYSSEEADEVRRLLGKKKIEAVAAAGQKFRQMCAENETNPEVAAIIWEQMAEFAKYSFNRSHAYGYAILGYWTAWLKFHYPVQFLTAVLSTVDKGRIPEFINEARRMGYRVLPPDVNVSGRGFSAGQMEVRYGLDGVKGVGTAAVEAIVKGQPYSDWDDFMARKGEANMGIVKTLAKVGAFDSLVPDRKALERRLEWETDGSANRCSFKDDSVLKPHGLPCTFDWDSEPAPIGKRGQELKRKPLPKKCSKACRQWTQPVLQIADTRPYTADEIMEKEMELLGVHLSATPFDRIPDEVLDDPEIKWGDEVESGPNGEYVTIGIVTKVRQHTAKNGKDMAFLGLYARNADLDVTVFNSDWEKYQRDLKKGTLCFAVLYKNDRGLTLSAFQPI